MLHKEDCEKISGQIELLKNQTIDWAKISRRNLRGQVQNSIEGAKKDLRAIAFQEIHAGNWVNHFQSLPISTVGVEICSFHSSREIADLQIACTGFSSHEASRLQRLQNLSLNLENGKKFEELHNLFRDLHKSDRTMIFSLLHDSKIEIFD